MEQKTYKANPLLIPLAIIVAGALVAGAIIYNGRVATNAALASSVTSSSTVTPTQSQVVTISIAGARFQGNTKANVGFIEFGDFECPYCQMLFQQTIPSLRTDYVNKGSVLYGFIDFPLTNIHPYAMIGAEAARCAEGQGQFWQMADKIYSTDQSANDQAHLEQYAADLGLNTSKFNSCLTNNTYASDIAQNIAIGNKLGVQGTPTVVIGTINHKNNTLTGTLVYGAEPLSAFQQVLNQYVKA